MVRRTPTVRRGGSSYSVTSGGLESEEKLPTQEIKLGPADRPLRILLPPGVGDIHWVLLRLRGLLKATGNDRCRPIVSVCSSDPAYDRSEAFVRMVPWVTFGGYLDLRPKRMHSYSERAFFNGKIFTDLPGFDLFLSVNKHVEQGMAFDAILPQAGPTDWDYPFEPDPVIYPVDGKFILATFYRQSFYKEWWDKYDPQLYLSAVCKELDDRGRPHQVLLVGAAWDAQILSELAGVHTRVKSIAGDTSFRQLVWLKRQASAFIGHPSGSGMLAQHIGCPTILLWGDWWQFTPGMRHNWAHPKMLEQRLYRALSVSDAPKVIADNLIEILR